jgi:hypothetical protein
VRVGDDWSVVLYTVLYLWVILQQPREFEVVVYRSTLLKGSIWTKRQQSSNSAAPDDDKYITWMDRRDIYICKQESFFFCARDRCHTKSYPTICLNACVSIPRNRMTRRCNFWQIRQHVLYWFQWKTARYSGYRVIHKIKMWGFPSWFRWDRLRRLRIRFLQLGRLISRGVRYLLFKMERRKIIDGQLYLDSHGHCMVLYLKSPSINPGSNKSDFERCRQSESVK